MKNNDLVERHPKKTGQRKYLRYEREYSNSMWHTGYKQLDEKRGFIAYQDDASRFLTGYGIFERATTQNALTVLYGAIKKHGKPASIMTDQGPVLRRRIIVQEKGGIQIRARTGKLNIRHILAEMGHTRTNGKVLQGRKDR